MTNPTANEVRAEIISYSAAHNLLIGGPTVVLVGSQYEITFVTTAARMRDGDKMFAHICQHWPGLQFKYLHNVST